MKTRSKIQNRNYSFQQHSQSSQNYSSFSFVHNHNNSDIYQSDFLLVKDQISQNQSKIKKEIKEQHKTQKQKQKSLNELTKKFLELIHESQNKTISASIVSEELSICKRRTYDLTNILQGFGLLKKVKARKFKWINLQKKQFQEILNLGKGIYQTNSKKKNIQNQIHLTQDKIKKFLSKNKKYIDIQDIKLVNKYIMM